MFALSNVPAKLRATFRAVAILIATACFLGTGCKISDDAAAAATQMSATAKALSDYYAALGTILANTDQIYILNEQLLAKPYIAENRQLLKNNEAELAKRAALAADFSTLAGQFAALSGSTAPADVAASAVNMETEIESLKSATPSNSDQNALTFALQQFVTAIKEHKEREATRAMDGFAKGLATLFTHEGEVWNSVEAVHTQVAANLAVYLVDHDGTDNSSLLKVALYPFGLSPATTTGDLKAALTPLAKQQIATRTAALDDSYAKATGAMAKSLQEMSDRIHAVAENKPMPLRMAPIALSTVDNWATQVAEN
jgi:cell division protein FtsL